MLKVYKTRYNYLIEVYSTSGQLLKSKYITIDQYKKMMSMKNKTKVLGE